MTIVLLSETLRLSSLSRDGDGVDHGEVSGIDTHVFDVEPEL